MQGKMKGLVTIALLVMVLLGCTLPSLPGLARQPTATPTPPATPTPLVIVVTATPLPPSGEQGVDIFDITPELATGLREGGVELPVDQGVLVMDVYQDSPAYQAGLQGSTGQARWGNLILPVGGDIIIAINGTDIRGAQELTIYLETQTTVGQAIQVTVMRDGREMTIEVQLAERPGGGRGVYA
jgi:S1-C subfamily serine protease